MTKKFLKVLFILLFMFAMCFSYVQATDIDLNLPGSNDVIDNLDENFQNPTDDQIPGDTSLDDSNDQNNINENDITPPPMSGTDTLLPSASQTSDKVDLSITDIINILLITVGVVIILFAIAILIRLKH